MKSERRARIVDERELKPLAEDAAGAAGEWVARNSPELVSETLVPRFIRGFEKAHRSSSDDDDGGESS